MKTKILTAAFIAIATAATAQDIPQKYLDEFFGEMAIAGLGVELCSDVKLNQDAFNKEGAAAHAEAKADGMSDDQITTMMESLKSNPDILTAPVMQFGQRHSISPTDMPGFCSAIKQEKLNGTRIGKMVQ